MDLNVVECHPFTISRKPEHRQIVTEYHIEGTILEKPTVMKDLGVLMDKELTSRHTSIRLSLRVIRCWDL